MNDTAEYKGELDAVGDPAYEVPGQPANEASQIDDFFAMFPAVVQASQELREQKEAEIENLIAAFRDRSQKKLGFFYVGPTTVVWASRGKFVEVAMTHLGHGDTFNRKQGLRHAIEMLLSNRFVLFPCDDKVPGFTAREVAENVFNGDYLCGAALAHEKSSLAAKSAFVSTMQKRGFKVRF